LLNASNPILETVPNFRQHEINRCNDFYFLADGFINIRNSFFCRRSFAGIIRFGPRASNLSQSGGSLVRVHMLFADSKLHLDQDEIEKMMVAFVTDTPSTLI